MTDPQADQQTPSTARLSIRGKLAIAAVVAILLALVIGYEAKGAGADAGLGGEASAAPYTVTIDGDGTATVTLVLDGSTSQQTDVALPYTATIPTGTRIVSVGAQLATQFGTSLSCSVTDGAGNVLRSAQSSGEFTTVTCADALG